MQQIKLKAYAKINLTLNAIGKRPDGYHLLDMIMHGVDIFDSITIIKNNKKTITLNSDNLNLPLNESNLAFKTAKLLLDLNGCKEAVDIHIEKKIPIGAGMAGGSADAAGIIIGMNNLFNLNLSLKEMQEFALKIGADVPYCIQGGCVRATGIGEIMQELDEMDLDILISKPCQSVSTELVYKNLNLELINHKADNEKFINELRNKNINEMIKSMANVLEPVTSQMVKDIDRIKNIMYNNNATISMMTGSGTAVFGLFSSQESFNNSYNELKVKYKDTFKSKLIKGGVVVESWH